MRTGAIYFSILLPVFLLVFLAHSVTALETGENTSWTEKKLGKVIVRADQAARHKEWSRAIKYGEQMIAGSAALDSEKAARYINLLKNLNSFYDKAGQLEEVAPRVKKAYRLSTEYLGPDHKTTKQSRILLYKLLVSRQDYHGAIPLVLENISTLKQNENHRRLHYLKQLYSLYKLTGQFEKEEQTILEYLELERRAFGSLDPENYEPEYHKAVLDLAENYCRQKKGEEFKALMEKYSLNYKCP